MLARTRIQDFAIFDDGASEHVIANALPTASGFRQSGLVYHGAAMFHHATMQIDMPVRTATKSPGISSLAGTLVSVSPITFLRLVGHIEK